MTDASGRARSKEEWGKDELKVLVCFLIPSFPKRLATPKAVGVDHCCALISAAASVARMNEQIQWFAAEVMEKL